MNEKCVEKIKKMLEDDPVLDICFTCGNVSNIASWKSENKDFGIVSINEDDHYDLDTIDESLKEEALKDGEPYCCICGGDVFGASEEEVEFFLEKITTEESK